MEYGTESMTNAELLSELLGTKVEVENLQDVVRAPSAIKNVGEKRSRKIYAIRELCQRLMIKESAPVEVIHGPEDVAHYFMPRMRLLTEEHFDILLLNTKNHILRSCTVSIGSVSASVVHPREVFKAACVHSAASIILVHNHPSGDPSPSREDIALTQRLVKAGRMMDIPVLDHIIIGDERFVSFKEKGLLN